MSEQLLHDKLENIISGHNINQDDADWLRATLAQPAEGEIMAAEKSSYVSASRPVYSTDHWGDEVTTWEPTKHFNYFVFARAIEAHHGIVEKGN